MAMAYGKQCVHGHDGGDGKKESSRMKRESSKEGRIGGIQEEAPSEEGTRRGEQEGNGISKVATRKFDETWSTRNIVVIGDALHKKNQRVSSYCWLYGKILQIHATVVQAQHDHCN